jgi:hypothetical protein
VQAFTGPGRHVPAWQLSPELHRFPSLHPLPFAFGKHVPADPATLQAVHPPVQAALQQTPSAQNPLAHSVPAVHALPFDSKLDRLTVVVSLAESGPPPRSGRSPPHALRVSSSTNNNEFGYRRPITIFQPPARHVTSHAEEVLLLYRYDQSFALQISGHNSLFRTIPPVLRTQAGRAAQPKIVARCGVRISNEARPRAA